jgi:hypothetical protein
LSQISIAPSLDIFVSDPQHGTDLSQQAPVQIVLGPSMLELEAAMVMPDGHTPGLKVGYVLVYWGGLQVLKDGSIQPLLGVFVLGAPPNGVGVPMKTA